MRYSRSLPIRFAVFFAAHAAVVSVALLLTACAANLSPGPSTASIGNSKNLETAKPDSKPRTARIALLLPMGGLSDHARIAKGMKQAAELALFDANNPAIQLIAKDDGGTPEGAVHAAEAAIKEGAEIIIGPLFAKSALAVQPIAAKSNVPIFSFSSEPSVAGNGVYLMSFLAGAEVERVVEYAASQGKKNFAALVPSDAYGQIVESVFRRAVQKVGGKVVILEHLGTTPNATIEATRNVFQTIKDAGRNGATIDALFLPASPEKIGELGPLIASSGIDTGGVKLIGTSAWEGPSFTRDPHMYGGWYAGSDPATWGAFAEKFRKAFGTEPPRVATLAYDATGAALKLAALPAANRFSSENITRVPGFEGIDGPFRFTQSGIVDRRLSILEIEKYRAVVIDSPGSHDDSDQKTASAATGEIKQR